MAKKLTMHVWVEHPEKGSILLKPGQAVPSWATDQVTNPACFAQAGTADQPDTGTDDPDGDDDGGDDTQVDYMSWTKDDLKAQVDRRNADYPEDDQIEVAAPGNKAELAAALTEDDERLQDDDPDGDADQQ